MSELASRIRALSRRVEQLERAPWPSAAAERATLSASVVPDLFLMACDPGAPSHQYVLKFSGRAWSLVADSTNLLPIGAGIFGMDITPVGGFGRKLGASHWVSGGGTNDITAWRSDDDGITWAIKASYDNFADSPHGLPVTRDAAGNIWWAEREASDLFRIKKSTDDGDSSSTFYTAGDTTESMYHAAAHPTKANVIAFAGLKQGGATSPTVIWVTTNGGSSWTRTELNPSQGPLTDSTALLFTDTGVLLYATWDVSGASEIMRVYSASSPYSSFAETDLLTANVTVFAGPFMASSRNPQFLGATWSDGTVRGHVWRRTSGAWTELTAPFAAGIVLFGLCYNGTNLYALGYDPTNADSILVAKAENAGRGSVTWTDITAAVNAATGDPWSLSALAASMIWEGA